MPDSLRLLLIDPDAARRQEVKDALSGLPFTIAAEAHYGLEALRLVVDLQPDIALVRVEAPLAPGLHMLSVVQDNAPRTTPVVLTSRDDATMTRKMMLAGARGLLVSPPSREALRRVLTTARQRHLSTLDRLERPNEFEPTTGGCIITVLGAKGGVGKTSVAVNLAIALASRTAAAVALVDTDPMYGDVALHMGVTRMWEPAHQVAGYEAQDAPGSEINADLMEHPSGVFVLASRPSPAGCLPEPQHIRRVLRQVASRFDFVVVDTPDGFGDHTSAALEASNVVILLTSSEVASVKDARVLRDALSRDHFDTTRIKLVVNHATSANSVTDQEIAHVVGEPIFWSFPHDPDAANATQSGEPLMLARPKSSLARGVNAMAALLGGIEIEEPRSWLHRLILGARAERY